MKKIEKYIKLRQLLHSQPELSTQEFNTRDILLSEIDLLDSDSILSVRVVETGIIVDLIGDGKANSKPKTIAFRSDIDALPIIEKTELPYKSKVYGTMHACGHDGHTVILLATLEELLLKRSSIPSNLTIRLVFQPSEEIFKGASLMIENGALDGVDYMFGLHNAQIYSLGTIAVIPGGMLSKSIGFSLNFIGKGGHGSMPHLCNNPILAAADAVERINAIPVNDIDAKKSLVLSFGCVQSGTKNAILPKEAILKGSARVFDKEVGNLLVEKITKAAETIATSWGCTVEIKFSHGELLENDLEATKIVEEVASSLFELSTDNLPSFASDDFAMYCGKVPSCYFLLGGRDEKRQSDCHTSSFDFNDSSIELGVSMFLGIVDKFVN